ncbi:glycosyltransferase [Alterinioella nitratireducens]|uniref:glycosyltransferase n=1 Tax=Rhodobacterales TaxID=204455 RepID=UPI00405863C2
MTRLAAVIVTYNRLGALKQTLSRVLEEEVDRVYVVDNASTDGTAEWLAARRDPRLQVLRLTENGGGAGGFAAGLAAAMEKNDPAEWCVLFDDDAWPEPGCLARFRETSAGIDADDTRPGALGAVAAAVFYPNGTICEMNRPNLNPFWHAGVLARTLLGGRGRFKVTDADLAPRAPARPLDVASFVGFFVSRGALRGLELRPEAGLFLYGDDVLYSLRLRRAGLRIELWPGLRFTHDCGTMGDGFVYRPLWKIYYHCRNGVQIAREAAGPVVFPAALAYYTLVWWRRGRSCPAESRGEYYRMMRAGLRDGLRGRRGRKDELHGAALAPVRSGR